jgi:hypothetical protein
MRERHFPVIFVCVMAIGKPQERFFKVWVFTWSTPFLYVAKFALS